MVQCENGFELSSHPETGSRRQGWVGEDLGVEVGGCGSGR